MSLADRIEAARPLPRGLPCPVSVILDALDERDRASLQYQLERPVWDPERLGNGRLATMLIEDGHRIHQKGIERHRNRECRCFAGLGQ